MPAPAGTKRVKGVSVFRPFGKAATSYAVHLDITVFTDRKGYTTVFGSIARPIDPNKKPPDLPAEHTHQWTVWVKGVDDEDISYWLKKVQFKLHETYANSLRTVEGPPFEVTETGWGEFEIQIKLYFVPESNEKPQSIWHGLKLHPYGPDAEQQRERREPIISQNYEEVIFNEPVEQFYEILTGASVQPIIKGKGSKGSKLSAYGKGNDGSRTAEIPYAESPGNPYSQKTEGKELDRMGEAIKTVEQMVKEERAKLAEREARLETLRKTEGVPTKKK